MPNNSLGHALGAVPQLHSPEFCQTTEGMNWSRRRDLHLPPSRARHEVGPEATNRSTTTGIWSTKAVPVGPPRFAEKSLLRGGRALLSAFPP